MKGSSGIFHFRLEHFYFSKIFWFGQGYLPPNLAQVLRWMFLAQVFLNQQKFLLNRTWPKRSQAALLGREWLRPLGEPARGWAGPLGGVHRSPCEICTTGMFFVQARTSSTTSLSKLFPNQTLFFKACKLSAALGHTGFWV